MAKSKPFTPKRVTFGDGRTVRFTQPVHPPQRAAARAAKAAKRGQKGSTS